jgi:kynurenine formamidase
MIDEDYWHFENLMHLDKLPTQGLQAVGIPDRLGGHHGAPVRAVGIVND